MQEIRLFTKENGARTLGTFVLLGITRARVQFDFQMKIS